MKAFDEDERNQTGGDIYATPYYPFSQREARLQVNCAYDSEMTILLRVHKHHQSRPTQYPRSIYIVTTCGPLYMNYYVFIYLGIRHYRIFQLILSIIVVLLNTFLDQRAETSFIEKDCLMYNTGPLTPFLSKLINRREYILAKLHISFIKYLAEMPNPEYLGQGIRVQIDSKEDLTSLLSLQWKLSKCYTLFCTLHIVTQSVHV